MDNKDMLGTINISNRKSVKVDGVESVNGFDENYVSLSTRLGKLVIEGHNLKIENLSKENENICVTGTIDSVFYVDGKERTSIFKSIFK
jgi:sporulation protein YabP